LKILITGINGFIGRHLKNLFFKKNYKVFGIRSKSQTNDYKILLKKKIKPNILIHCAGSGIVGFNNVPYKIHKQKNLNSTKKLIAFVKKAKLRNSKIIFLSSQAVYGKVSTVKISEKNKTQPISNYGKTKFLAEKELKKITDNFVIVLRLFSIYGNGLRKQIIWDACNKFINKEVFFRGNGKEKRDFLHILDLIGLLKKIIKSEPKTSFAVFNVGSGKGIKIKTLLIKIKKIYKSSLKISFMKNGNKQENQNFVSNNRKIINTFDWKPKKNLNKELKFYIKWFKNI
jgi:UDP-glucose 4-epimerase